MTKLGTSLKTHFAPPERESQDVVLMIAEKLKGEPLIKWFDAVPMATAIINKHRQILFCNTTFCKLSAKEECQDVLGLRPGEALDCVNATVEEAGCGCSDFCSVCGAAKAIIKSLDGVADCQECRMVRLERGSEVPLDLQVFTQPIEFEGKSLTAIFALDISHEQRLRYLNRTFHHSLVNGVGGINALTDLIETDVKDTPLMNMLVDSTKRTLNEVLYHRDIEAAETGRLGIQIETFDATEFLDAQVKEECRHKNTQHTCAEVGSSCMRLTSDKRILGHVVRNMLQNALEAREETPGSITLSCRALEGDRIVIAMENPGTIPADMQKQMFKRYVSTKSRDRGLGTYVMKLFTERYLNGEVTFTSKDDVTTFQVIIPAGEPEVE